MNKYLTVYAILASLLTTSVTKALEVIVPATESGWYRDDGQSILGNYIAGTSRLSNNSYEYRNFFVFDLSTVAVPIASAELRLFNHSQTTSPVGIQGYNSDDETEEYVVREVGTSIDTLFSGMDSIPVFDELGSGSIFGSYTASAADNGTLISIPLNSDAVSALNATDELFAFGGAIATLDDIARVQHLFANSHRDPRTRLLVLNLVPEPTALMLGLVACSTLVFRLR